MATKTPITVIIGSSRFKQFHLGHAQRFTLQGRIVLVAGFWHHVDNFPITNEVKDQLDELMLRKIDLADEVFVVNINGYLGESTKKAIRYVLAVGGKILSFAEPVSEGALAAICAE